MGGEWGAGLESRGQGGSDAPDILRRQRDFGRACTLKHTLQAIVSIRCDCFSSYFFYSHIGGAMAPLVPPWLCHCNKYYDDN